MCSLLLASLPHNVHSNFPVSDPEATLTAYCWKSPEIWEATYFCESKYQTLFKSHNDCGHRNICTTTQIYASSVYVCTSSCELEMWNCKLHNCKQKHPESAWTPHGFLCYFLKCGKNCYILCRCIFQREDPSQHIPAVVLDHLM